MENLRNMTVKRLQAKCRENGVPSSGNKDQLVLRIEEFNEKDISTVPHGVEQRLLQLEEQAAKTRSLVEHYRPEFEPSNVSSPLQAFMTPGVSQNRAEVQRNLLSSDVTAQQLHTIADIDMERRYVSSRHVLSAQNIPSVSSYNESHVPPTNIHAQNIP